MKLVLAEKPSVAQSIAKVLGATKREDGYLEGNGYVVSWCVGHLVELSQPEAYDEKYNKWAYDKKSNIVEIYHDLTNGNAAPYRDFLEQVIEDSDEISVVQAATQLKNELDKAVSRPKESVIDPSLVLFGCPPLHIRCCIAFFIIRLGNPVFTVSADLPTIRIMIENIDAGCVFSFRCQILWCV